MGDKNNIANLSSVINKGISEYLKDVHTSLPGIIEEFDPETQLAKVQPAIKRKFITRDGDREFITPVNLPLLINVPVIFPSGGGFQLTFPVAKGDECLLSFCERSIDNWHNRGGVREPLGKRFFSLSDATALVGLNSTPNKISNFNPTDAELRSSDGAVRVTIKSDKIEVAAPNIEHIGNVKITGNLEVTESAAFTSEITSNGVNIGDKHKHDGSPTAPSGPKSDTGIVK